MSDQSAFFFVEDRQIKLNDAHLSGESQLARFEYHVTVVHPVEILQLLWSHLERYTLTIFIFNFVEVVETPKPVFQESFLLFS
ncbi:UNVERIFIED_ORG: hypothetical protein J2S99_000292 [Atlantibacter hermannii]|nr:hypothetical protein [Atlantibacter hermannii]